MTGLNNLIPLEAKLSAGLVADVFEELRLIRAEEEFLFEKEEVGHNKLIDEFPAGFPEAVDYFRHVLDGDAGAHQAQQPAIDEALGDDVEFSHGGVQIGHPQFDC